jgi:hypothetical protein
MRLGNHAEAERAASFIGRNHKFTFSGWTVTRGGEHSTSRTTGYSQGSSQSSGHSATRGWSGDGLVPWDRTTSGGRSRSRDRGHSEEWSQSDAASDGASWSTAQSIQRVYEYSVEPTVLQNLPGCALLLPAHGTAGPGLLAVECDPQIISLPGATASLATPDDPAISRPAAEPSGWPELALPGQPPAWQPWQDSPTDSASAWPPQQPAPRRPRPDGWS